jgi:hypothetical protein
MVADLRHKPQALPLFGFNPSQRKVALSYVQDTVLLSETGDEYSVKQAYLR